MSDDLLRFASQLEAGLTDEVKTDLMQRVIVVTERTIFDEMPEKTGKLKASMVSRYDASGGEIGFADYAVFAHEPTRPHVILPKYTNRGAASELGGGSHVLAFAYGGTTVFAHSVRHPGTPGNPFIDRGLDKAGADIDAALLATAGSLLGGL